MLKHLVSSNDKKFLMINADRVINLNTESDSDDPKEIEVRESCSDMSLSDGCGECGHDDRKAGIVQK